MLFLIPLLGLITSFSFGFSSNTNVAPTSSKTVFHAFDSAKVIPVLKYIDEEDFDKAKFLVDESESEIDLESYWYSYSNLNLSFLELHEADKTATTSCHFFALQYKIPLYKLFCKWKLHLS